jgi:hypothetical protein
MYLGITVLLGAFSLLGAGEAGKAWESGAWNVGAWGARAYCGANTIDAACSSGGAVACSADGANTVHASHASGTTP